VVCETGDEDERRGVCAQRVAERISAVLESRLVSALIVVGSDKSTKRLYPQCRLGLLR
jgi:hypothetical protein